MFKYHRLKLSTETFFERDGFSKLTNERNTGIYCAQRRVATIPSKDSCISISHLSPIYQLLKTFKMRVCFSRT